MDTKNRYEFLLVNAIDGFYEAMINDQQREKYYYKGLSEGIMKIVREADLLGTDFIAKTIDDAKLRYSVAIDNQQGFDLSDIDTPTFIREGKDISHYLV